MTTFSTDGRARDDLSAAQEEIRHLQRALSTRPVIDQAKGMLMARHGRTADEAFAMLAAASQRSNRPVSELARAIVEHAGSAPCPRTDALARSGRGQGVADDSEGNEPGNVDSLLARAAARDQRAEQRDRAAELRDLEAERRAPGDPHPSDNAAADREQAAIDRVQSGADRDASAAERAELLSCTERPDRRTTQERLRLPRRTPLDTPSE